MSSRNTNPTVSSGNHTPAIPTDQAGSSTGHAAVDVPPPTELEWPGLKALLLTLNEQHTAENPHLTPQEVAGLACKTILERFDKVKVEISERDSANARGSKADQPVGNGQATAWSKDNFVYTASRSILPILVKDNSTTAAPEAEATNSTASKSSVNKSFTEEVNAVIDTEVTRRVTLDQARAQGKVKAEDARSIQMKALKDFFVLVHEMIDKEVEQRKVAKGPKRKQSGKAKTGGGHGHGRGRGRVGAVSGVDGNGAESEVDGAKSGGSGKRWQDIAAAYGIS